MTRPDFTIIYDDDGEEIQLPTRNALCPRCDGEGKHVNPAVDGWSVSDEHVDEDFIESYFAGHYDVVCEQCHGNKVVKEVDEERCTPEQFQQYVEQIKDYWETEAMYAAERRMGA